MQGGIGDQVAFGRGQGAPGRRGVAQFHLAQGDLQPGAPLWTGCLGPGQEVPRLVPVALAQPGKGLVGESAGGAQDDSSRDVCLAPPILPTRPVPCREVRGRAWTAQTW